MEHKASWCQLPLNYGNVNQSLSMAFFCWDFLNLSGLLPIKIIYWDLKGQPYMEGRSWNVPCYPNLSLCWIGNLQPTTNTSWHIHCQKDNSKKLDGKKKKDSFFCCKNSLCVDSNAWSMQYQLILFSFSFFLIYLFLSNITSGKITDF